MLRKKQLPEVEPVKLKPFHGIRPGIYIIIFWALVVLLLSFLLFVLPGLVSNTAYVTFNEPIVGSGVLEDGVYLGSGTDGVYKTTGGNHTYTFIYEGEEYGSIETKVKRKVFFSFFSHKPVLIEPERSYSESVKAKIEEAFIRDVTSYSAVISAPSTFHYPPLFSAFAKNVVEAGLKDVRDTWLLAVSHISSTELYEDYKEGRGILEKNNVTFQSNESKEIEALLPYLFEGKEKTIDRSETSVVAAPLKDGDFFHYPSSNINMGESITLSVESAKEAPVSIKVDEFSIAKNLVTEHDWALFVAANPKWSIDNLDNLVEEGLVDTNYLKGITLSPYITSIRPIRNISYYAAEAYCEWKSKVDGVEYHIPTEGEWYTAALSSSGKDFVTSLIYVENNPTTPTAMLGQLWEFTSTPFIPLSRLSDYDKIITLSNEWKYDDVIVKGGSYVSDPSSITIETVGTTSKSMCSEFCGLRLAK